MRRNIEKIKLLIVFILLVAVLSGCSGNKEEEVRLVLDWTPNTNHTGFYVALEKGYYEQAGLNVIISQPPDEGALALVGAEKAEFAISFQESLGPAIAANNPVPVVAVAGLIQHNTSGIISLAQSAIQSPKDLAGKRFATWGTPLVDATMRHIVEGDGGVFEEVIMVPDSATDVISALQTRIDAIWIYYAWDGIAAELNGIDYNYFDFITYDEVFDFYSPILVVNQNYLANNSEKAKAFIEATGRGYNDAIENPDEAAAILLKYAPELDEQLVLESQRWLAGQYIADGPYWGYIDTQRWASFYDWMYAQGLLDRPLQDAGFTNDFLPQ